MHVSNESELKSEMWRVMSMFAERYYKLYIGSINDRSNF